MRAGKNFEELSLEKQIILMNFIPYYRYAYGMVLNNCNEDDPRQPSPLKQLIKERKKK